MLSVGDLVIIVSVPFAYLCSHSDHGIQQAWAALLSVALCSSSQSHGLTTYSPSLPFCIISPQRSKADPSLAPLIESACHSVSAALARVGAHDKLIRVEGFQLLSRPYSDRVKHALKLADALADDEAAEQDSGRLYAGGRHAVCCLRAALRFPWSSFSVEY